jgi:carbamoyl-phosphate synthase small subunit
MNSNANLILDDGSVWPGRFFGAQPPEPESLAAAKDRFGGEVIFNTGMTGYHEILTDPSYTGQIVMMTYPHIGNYGDDDAWSEVGPESGRSPGRGIKAQGLVVRSFHDGPVPEGRMTLSSFLSSHMVSGISEVDTRGLTLKTRREGSRNGVIVSVKNGSPTTSQMSLVMEYLDSMPSMNGRNLTGEVGIGTKEVFNPDGEPHIALLDCGVKMNILRELIGRGCRVTVLPSGAVSQDVLDLNADALLLSNGPGDPEPLDGPASVARDLMGRLPLWGICLGLQVLSRAAGGRTYKMSFGHHA